MLARLRKFVLRFGTFHLSMLISLLIFSLFLLKEEQGWNFGLFDMMELKALDLKFLARGAKPEHGHVSIAAVDEKSIERYGRWPWNRIVIARMIAKLAEMGASVVAFDVVFSDEDRSQIPRILATVAEQVDEIELEKCDSGCEDMRDAVLDFLREEIATANPDKILAEVIEKAGNVVLGFFIFTNPEEVANLDRKRLDEGLELITPSKIGLLKPWDPEEEKFYKLTLRKGLAVRAPLPILAEATDYFGHFSFHQDDDGALRWGDLLQEVQSDDPDIRLIYPSLSLKAAAVHLDTEIVVHTYPKGVDRITLGLNQGSPVIPVNYLGRLLINYLGPERTFPTLSIADIIDGNVNPAHVKDRIILVGATAIGVYDLRVTPFQEDFPGVEIHANVIDNILSGNYLSRPDWAFFLELFIILFFGIFFGIVLGRVPALYGALFVVVVLSGYYLVDRHYFFANGYWIYTVLPMSQAFLIFFVVYIYRYVTEERDKKRTRAAFTQYLNAQVVDALMNDYDKLKLGGEKREITVLFSDIKDFTSMSEKLSPDELGHLLAEYLNPMTDIVFEHQGVLDKYIGDAVMAFWGAPNPQEDHAARACRTGLHMIKKLNELNDVWKARGIPHLEIRVGINTGPMWVGNMGSQVRFDYTVIGDAVNLGSRLEGTNKQYGTTVMISEFTYEHVKHLFVCRELDSIRVKGKLEPVTIYELVEEGEGEPEILERVERFHKGLAAYRAQKWEEASGVFHDLLLDYPDDGPAKVFISRCKQYIESPPPADWDGVYVMTTK